ncbi:MAG: GNAT family N-acetyltransferase [Ferruginibacter sp.]
MPSISIQIAKTNDAEIISEISRKTFYDSFAADNTKEDVTTHMQEYYNVAKMKEELADKNNIFLLAWYENELVGYVKMRVDAKEESKDLLQPIEIERIYSVKNMIGKGVGKAMMQRCLDIAKEKNKQTIWLGVWEKNFSAMAFYTKWGFEKFGQHIFVVGNDAQTDLLMKKDLTAG